MSMWLWGIAIAIPLLIAAAIAAMMDMRRRDRRAVIDRRLGLDA